jgi:hypothetical protein
VVVLQPPVVEDSKKGICVSTKRNKSKQYEKAKLRVDNPSIYTTYLG